MKKCFKVGFPLVLECDGSFFIRFERDGEGSLEFNRGMYYLCGENGAGKTTFVNMLALIAGRIGEQADKDRGSIWFDGKAYNGQGFDYIKAAEIREKSFCIFPQKAFFLPISTRDNYIILNGSDSKKADSFSSREYPDLLSGGQQQKILMDIVLDEKKPVWFLDEPLSNMDSERRHYFWNTLDRAFKKRLRTAFFIDHWMDQAIRDDEDFRHHCTLRVCMENRWNGKTFDTLTKEIEIYENYSPEEFFSKQIRKIEDEKDNKDH